MDLPDLQAVVKALGGIPTKEELDRLADHYEKYGEARRLGILYGYFEGKQAEEILEEKYKALDIEESELTKQQKGGHHKWVPSKINNLIFRILYLRYRLDKGLTRVEANQQLYKHDYGLGDFLELSQASIRRKTRSSIAD